jgi:hypothetical protein
MEYPYSRPDYIYDVNYAVEREQYIRPFLLIQDDLIKIFEYVDPRYDNRNTYSYRIHELLQRTCIEIESNFKAILKANTYSPKEKNWNIKHYKKINKTHHLDEYKVQIPLWAERDKRFQPFGEWKISSDLSWYQAHNHSKHDSHTNFKEANLENLVNAVSGLFVLLSSQFYSHSLALGISESYIEIPYSSADWFIGKIFKLDFPTNWTDDEKYDFNWVELRQLEDSFTKIDYNNI